MTELETWRRGIHNERGCSTAYDHGPACIAESREMCPLPVCQVRDPVTGKTAHVVCSRDDGPWWKP